MKSLRILLAALLAFAPMAAQAGVTLNQVPKNNAAVQYIQLIDGTFVPVSATNPMPASGSFSATLSGFTAATTGTPITATTGGATGTLPAGTVVVAANKDASNIAYCKLGASATVNDQPIAPGGGWFAFTVLANTQLTCITASSTAVINTTGGAGLPTGTGGGGGSGGGGAVTNAGTFAVQPAGSVAHDGVGTSSNPNLQGCYSSAAAPTDVSADGDATRAWCLRNGARASVITAGGALVGGDATNGLDVDITRNAALVAGSAIIGKVGMDQTTPGTTNGVYVTNNGVAIDATTSGQTPSTVACNALSATPTAYTTAHTGPISCDLYGNIVTQPYSLPQNRVQGAITSAMTGTTSTSLIAAPGANLFNYITGISCVNSHATVGTLVAVQDGSGGTTLFTMAAAAVFGGDNRQFLSPFKQTTANTALYVANVTTGASTTCMATGYKAP